MKTAQAHQITKIYKALGTKAKEIHMKISYYQLN